MTTKDTYGSALRASEKVAWKLDDVLQADASFDFSMNFMPDALVDAGELSFFDEEERRTLNHIRAHGYLCTFGLVEEFILPFVLARLQARVDADLTEVRALLAFAGEEAKHIELFRRFRDVFEHGFGHRCEVIGPARAISDHVLGHGELGVGLLILHIEWMTQRHYVDLVHDRNGVEPRFRSLLHQHWVEESQHARLDTWIVESVAGATDAPARERAFGEYTTLLGFLDEGLTQQVELDLEAFERAAGRTLNGRQRDTFRAVQQRSQRKTYLGAGVSHPRVRDTVGRIHPPGLADLERLATTFGGTA